MFVPLTYVQFLFLEQHLNQIKYIVIIRLFIPEKLTHSIQWQCGTVLLNFILKGMAHVQTLIKEFCKGNFILFLQAFI